MFVPGGVPGPSRPPLQEAQHIDSLKPDKPDNRQSTSISGKPIPFLDKLRDFISKLFRRKPLTTDVPTSSFKAKTPDPSAGSFARMLSIFRSCFSSAQQTKLTPIIKQYTSEDATKISANAAAILANAEDVENVQQAIQHLLNDKLEEASNAISKVNDPYAKDHIVIEIAKKYLAKNDEANALKVILRTSIRAGDTEKARVLYQSDPKEAIKFISDCNSHFDVIINIGELVSNGNLDQAVKEATADILKYTILRDTLLTKIAEKYLDLGNHKKAIEIISISSSNDTKTPVFIKIADKLIQEDHLDDAYNAIRKSEVLPARIIENRLVNKNRDSVILKIAQRYIERNKMGDKTKAIELAKLMLDDEEDGRTQIAMAFNKKGDNESAMKVIRFCGTKTQIKYEDIFK